MGHNLSLNRQRLTKRLLHPRHLPNIPPAHEEQMYLGHSYHYSTKTDLWYNQRVASMGQSSTRILRSPYSGFALHPSLSGLTHESVMCPAPARVRAPSPNKSCAPLRKQAAPSRPKHTPRQCGKAASLRSSQIVPNGTLCTPHKWYATIQYLIIAAGSPLPISCPFAAARSSSRRTSQLPKMEQGKRRVLG